MRPLTFIYLMIALLYVFGGEVWLGILALAALLFSVWLEERTPAVPREVDAFLASPRGARARGTLEATVHELTSGPEAATPAQVAYLLLQLGGRLLMRMLLQ